jgi:hypothetical protein
MTAIRDKLVDAALIITALTAVVYFWGRLQMFSYLKEIGLTRDIIDISLADTMYFASLPVLSTVLGFACLVSLILKINSLRRKPIRVKPEVLTSLIILVFCTATIATSYLGTANGKKALRDFPFRPVSFAWQDRHYSGYHFFLYNSGRYIFVKKPVDGKRTPEYLVLNAQDVSGLVLNPADR